MLLDFTILNILEVYNLKFNKILIANRGEIANRIIRTCKKLGITTVAIYSEADKDLAYVREADESVLIGEPPANKSYLNIDAIISIAKDLNVDAIHPGYGFLAENEKFVERCEEEDIVFIGPKSEVIMAMGNKIEARRRMQEAGVPVVPGSDEEVHTLDEALEIAEEIGYPVMLKASAGGGGIGMSLVSSAEELKKTFDSNKMRSQNYFGDSRVFIEKYIANSRHIEVQIAADHEGNTVHLFERECSVQRRNQKVIEESPSPTLSDKQKEALYTAAINGAKAIKYSNLGTMEFILDDSTGNFYFLEMNTRLQVEHPVTESITDLDLVEWQIRIAEGELLPVSQDEINKVGHAIECRIYAEDPIRFFPSPGTITKLEWPKNIRIDTSIEEGSTITPFYDPMIAKIVVHGENRNVVINKMNQALTETKIEGIKSNIPMLMEVLEYEDFKEGKYSTQIVEKMRSQMSV